jgi:hypothetical protein
MVPKTRNTGLKADRKAGRKSSWNLAETQRLRELWGTMRDSDVAAALGKTISVIRFRATKLKLREEKGRRAGCRPGKITYPWNRTEDLVLIKNVGHLSIFELMEMLPRRNRVAIERRCYELGFSPTQGTYTRGKIERDTGYDWRQIRRARDGTGQVWKRYGIRKYMISSDQVEEIIEWLKNEKRKWSRQYNLDACITCGVTGFTERERHSGDGKCKKCWDKRRHARSWATKAIAEEFRSLSVSTEITLTSFLIISRDPLITQFIKESDARFENAMVIPSAHAEDVKNKVVAGTVPFNLASLCMEFVNIEIPSTANKFIDTADMRDKGVRLISYRVAVLKNKRIKIIG